MKKLLSSGLGSLFLILLLIGIGWAQNPTEDPAPVNIAAVSAMRDIRQFDASTPIGLGGVKGEFFHLNIRVQLSAENSLFDKLSRARKAMAYHSNGRSYELFKIEGCEQWLGAPSHQYNLMLRVDEWMFSGTWTFELIYRGTDGRRHIQRRDFNMIPGAGRPGEITGPRVIKSPEGMITASWDAIGIPLPPGSMLTNFVYQVRLYDQAIDLGCAVDELNMEEWDGTGHYDHMTNRVNFTIPPEFSGKPLRFETRINTLLDGVNNSHRACYVTVAP